MCPKCHEMDNLAQGWENSCMVQVQQKRALEKEITALENKVKRLKALAGRLLLTVQHEDELAARDAKQVLADE